MTYLIDTQILIYLCAFMKKKKNVDRGVGPIIIKTTYRYKLNVRTK